MLITPGVNSCGSGGAGSARARPALLPALPVPGTPIPYGHVQKSPTFKGCWKHDANRGQGGDGDAVSRRQNQHPARPFASLRPPWGPPGEGNADCAAVRCSALPETPAPNYIQLKTTRETENAEREAQGQEMVTQEVLPSSSASQPSLASPLL